MTSSGASSAKICIYCKQDCSGKPRSKDPQGRYMCRECLTRAQAKASAAPAPEAAAADDDASILAALVSDRPAATECPSCGAALKGGAVVCGTCGYNLRTGEMPSFPVTKAPRESGAGSVIAGAALSGAGAALSGAGVLAGNSLVLVLSGVGGALGGVMGAGIWAAVAYNLHLEVGYVAWGVGILVGIGALVGARGHEGATTGILAAVIALASVVGGKYWAISMVAAPLEARARQRLNVDDEQAIAEIGQALAIDQAAAGKSYAWPEGAGPEDAWEETDFPAPIWADAAARWAALAPAEQEERKRELEARLRSVIQASISDAKTEGLIESMSPFDILWFFLAVGTAFKIGSGIAGDED